MPSGRATWQRLKKPSALALCAVVVALLAPTGCSSGPGITIPVDWSEPAWMTQARAEVEEYQEAMLSCLAEYGVVGILAAGAGVVVGGSVDDPPGASELRSIALDSCSEQITPPQIWSAPIDEQTYYRVAQARECIWQHGVEVEEMPTRDAWLDQPNRWFPHHALQYLDDATFRAVMEACPQPGGRGGLIVVVSHDW